MAALLYRLGRSAYRRRRRYLAVWAVLLAATGVGAVTLSGGTTNSFSIPGTESQRAIDLLSQRLPAATGASGRIVFAVQNGQLSRDAVQATLEKVRSAPQVESVSDPFERQLVSQNGRIALAQVTWKVDAENLSDATREATQRAAELPGAQVEFGGDAVLDEGGGPGGVGELLGVGVAALVLAITFGSLLSAGLPLLTALVGIAFGLLGIQIATGFFELNGTVPTLALMIGLAVGIDYALFIISRHRAQLFEGIELEESVGRAIASAGSAVVFAGTTVVIALSALSVVGIPFLTAMGLAAAATVIVAVLASITLVPALLGFAGMRIAKGKNFQTGPRAAEPTLGARWVAFVLRHRLPAALATIAALAALAIPMTQLRLGLSDDSTAAPDQTNRQAYELSAKAFGPGFNGPLTVVVDAGAGKSAQVAAADVQKDLRTLADVASVGDATLNPAGDTAVISVIPRSGPSTEATETLVRTIRERTADFSGANVLVTGQTAVNIDISRQLSNALIPYMALIVTLGFLLLTLAFRSIAVPLTAVGGFVLTIGAAFGVMVAVFQEGFGAGLFGVAEAGPIVSFLPVVIIGILFGLAMDYQVFLVSRMREEHAQGADPHHAITDGFRHGARVVTGAALIMGAVFSGFILEEDTVIKALGFTLAFGILIDAFIVRMTLIPALMGLLGPRAWWLPRWFDRVLPHIDTEGELKSTPA